MPNWTPEAPVSAAARVYQPKELKFAQPSRRLSDAWEVFRCVPEVHYVVTQQSRLVFRLNWDVEVDGVAAEPEQAEDFMREAFGNAPDLARMAAIHLQVAGAYWLARIGKKWRVLPDPISDTKQRQRLEQEADVLLRIWMPDPQDEEKPDSPVLAALDIAKELILARAQARAQARNRTAQLGILLYPRDGVDDPDEFEEAMSEVMTAPLADEKSAAVAVPNLVGFNSELIDKWKMLDVAGDHDEDLADRIERLVRQLAVAMDAPPEILLGVGDTNHWCRPVGTLAYTRQGWAVPEIGEDILTTDGWSTVRDLYHADAAGDPGLRLTVCNEHGGPHSYTIDATVGHSFYVERDGERLLTGDPLPGDLIYRGLDQRSENREHAVYDDAFVRLMAWYSSDGTLTGTEDNPRQIRIGKRDNWPLLEQVLVDLWGPAQDRMSLGADKPMWRHEVRADGLHLAVLNRHARNEVLRVVPTKAKTVPLDFVRQLTTDQLGIFLDAWGDADGHRESGGYQISQRDSSRLDAPEYAAIMLGYGVRRYQTASNGFKAGVLHSLRISPKRVRVQKVEPVVLDTEVWCPSTAAGTWLALDPTSGWSDYTGNSAWLIQEDNWLGHVEPYALIIGSGFARAVEEATQADEDTIQIAPDPAPLLRRRPSISDALSAHRDGLVSDDWTREQLGADDDDAPVSVEMDRAVTLAIDLAKSAPTLAASPGLDVLAEQIGRLLAGESAPALNEAVAEEAAAENEPEQPEIAAVPEALPFDLDALVTADESALDALLDTYELSVERALQKVGGKLRSMAQRDKTLTLPEGSNAEIAVLVDVSGVPNLDVTILGAVDEYTGQVRRVLTRAFARTRAAGVPLSTNGQDVASAVELFRTTAAVTAADALQGRPTRAAVWEAAVRVRGVAGGNGDPLVQVAAVRTAQSGIALGVRAHELVQERWGLIAGKWRWVHTYSGPNPHPEHEALNGIVVDHDYILRDGINWQPGDHEGCRCVLVPEYERVT